MIPRLARRFAGRDPDDRVPQTNVPATPAFPERGLKPRSDENRLAATNILFERLLDTDAAEVEERIEPDYRWLWEAAGPAEHKRMVLSFGLLYGVEGVITRSGLSPAMPPREVHSMAHGWVIEIGGSYYLADLVLGCMNEIRCPPATGSRVLDFSCSSGRVVRPLIAALPDVRWYGCDPNAGAIDWLREHAPDLQASVSPTAPPLAFEHSTFDLVFAMSVWSHYSASAALAWLEELHRLIRPRGHALITTHGLQSCVWFTQNPDAAIEHRLGSGWIVETAHRLQQDGHCFWDVFGDEGDWGVVDKEWGLAFFTPEWLLEHTTPQWELRSFHLGGAYGNQDVYVLERR